MTLPRIFSTETLQNTETCLPGTDNLRYLKNVLRLRPGDPIIVFDGFGNEFTARIESFGASGVRISLGEALPRTEKKIQVTLAQAIPKAGKMDWIVKTAAELGADVIIPFVAERSVSRIEGEKAQAKVGRWQKIVREAARCSRSPVPAVIEPILSFADMLLRAMPPSRNLIFWEEEQRQNIRDVLNEKEFADAGHYFIIVGPEGGLTRDEVARAKASGFISVSLGKRILKVETAAAAILAIIQYEKGIFSQTMGEGGK